MGRDMVVLVHGKLNVSHCALAARRAKHVLEGIRQSITSWAG